MSAVVLIVAATLVIQAAPAGAQTYGGGMLVRNQAAPQYCMDASLDKNEEGREAYIFQCHGHFNQRWTFTRGSTGANAIIGFDGRCLDIRGRSVRDNAPIQLWNCNYAANQQYQVTPIGQIRETVTGKCLTIANQAANRRPVFIDDCDGNPRQLWTIKH